MRNALMLLPDERFIYYGDNKNAPYGDRTEEDILILAENAADFLVNKGVKTLVVACNTATSASIKVLRERLDVPVVSVEPAIKPACALPGTGKVLMLATVATTKLSRYRALVGRMPDPERVVSIGCSGIVERVEAGITDEDAFDDLLEDKLCPYEGLEVSGIVLGCTHFPFIKPAFERYAGKHFTGERRFFDGNEGTARQLWRVLSARGLSAEPGKAPDRRVTFLTSGDPGVCGPIFERLLAIPIT